MVTDTLHEFIVFHAPYTIKEQHKGEAPIKHGIADLNDLKWYTYHLTMNEATKIWNDGILILQP